MAKDYQYEIMKDLQGFFLPGQREAIYNSCVNPRDKMLIRLLWKTGRRITEILMLKVKEIDFENANILWHIIKKKKKTLKWKPVDKRTLVMLFRYINWAKLSPEDYVFKSSHNPDKAISRQWAFQIVQNAAKRAGIHYVGSKKPHPHHFRHTFAIEMAKKLKNPADVRKLQLIMEHANMGMTEQYLQFGDEDLRELIESI